MDEWMLLVVWRYMQAVLCTCVLMPARQICQEKERARERDREKKNEQIQLCARISVWKEAKRKISMALPTGKIERTSQISRVSLSSNWLVSWWNEEEQAAAETEGEEEEWQRISPSNIDSRCSRSFSPVLRRRKPCGRLFFLSMEIDIYLAIYFRLLAVTLFAGKIIGCRSIVLSLQTRKEKKHCYLIYEPNAIAADLARFKNPPRWSQTSCQYERMLERFSQPRVRRNYVNDLLWKHPAAESRLAWNDIIITEIFLVFCWEG